MVMSSRHRPGSLSRPSPRGPGRRAIGGTLRAVRGREVCGALLQGINDGKGLCTRTLPIAAQLGAVSLARVLG